MVESSPSDFRGKRLGTGKCHTLRPVRDSLREYARGVVGGLMFSLPMLYTMEVWWAGFQLRSERILLLLGFTVLLLLGYNVYAGVRKDETWAGVIIDSVEEVGLALIVSAGFLLLLGRIGPGDSLRGAMGKVVVEALLIAIGISIGTSQLQGDGDDDDEERGARPRDILGVISLSACGAVVLATNIAPTDEIVVLAYESTSWRLAGMVLVSLVLGGLVMLFSDLVDSETDQPAGLRFLFGTVVSYAVAFVSSAIVLFLFGRFDGVALEPCVAMTVVLTVASSMGAAAGKILIR